MTPPPQEWSLTALCFVLMLQSFGMSRMISRLQRIVFKLEDMAFVSRPSREDVIRLQALRLAQARCSMSAFGSSNDEIVMLATKYSRFLDGHELPHSAHTTARSATH